MDYKEMIENLGKELKENQVKEIEKQFAAAQKLIDESKDTMSKESKEKFDEVMKSIESKLGKDSEYMKNIQTQLDGFEAKLKDGFKKDNFTSIFKKSLESDSYKKFISNGSGRMKFNVNVNENMFGKAAGNILVGDYAGSQNFNDTYGATMREPGITDISTRQPFITQLVNVSPTDKPLISYVQQTAVTDGTGAYTEGNSPSQSEYTYVAATAEVKKIGHFIKISRETLEDYDGMENEFRSNLLKYLLLKLDYTILKGATGSGDAFNGIISYAAAFDATIAGLDQSVVNANNTDVIVAAAAQIQIGLFMPDFIVMHPGDVANMNLDKDDNGQYTLPPFKSADGNTIAGVRVVSNTGVTLGSFLMGQFDRCSVRVKRDVEVEIYFENENDALTELVTMKATVRGTAYVKSNEAKAFVTGTFAAAKIQLDTTPLVTTTAAVTTTA